MKNKILILILINILVLNSLYSEHPKTDKARIKKILEKSLIFPGWGHLYEKQYFKGIIFMSSEIFCIVQSIINNNKANKFYKKYRHAENTDDTVNFRLKTEKYDKKRNSYILAGALVWIANLVDIYIHSKKKYKKKISFYIRQDETENIYLGFNIHF